VAALGEGTAWCRGTVRRWVRTRARAGGGERCIRGYHEGKHNKTFVNAALRREGDSQAYPEIYLEGQLGTLRGKD